MLDVDVAILTMETADPVGGSAPKIFHPGLSALEIKKETRGLLS